MDNDNRKRRVSRQNWKPGRFWAILHTLWTFAYSAFKVAMAAVATVLAIVAICAVVFVGVLADYLEGDIQPQAGIQLEGFDLSQPSYIYYTDDVGNIQVLQKLYATTDNEWADYEEIPQYMIYAAVSIEDHRFFEHQGVDWFTTIKACLSMFMGSSDFGGSSITQQLIKNMLLTEDETANDVTVQRKLLEIFRATEFEKRYDKSVVLEWYMNYIFLGNGCTGVKVAAEKYFGKELEDLNAAECACIISITNNPSIFNPISDREITYKGETRTSAEWNRVRREDTLYMMYQYGYLTEEEYEQSLIDSENLVFKSGVDFEDRYSDCEACGYHAHNDTFVYSNSIYYCPECGAETTISEDASQYVYSWFVDTVINDLAVELAARDGLEATDEVKKMYRTLIANGGYHIYSTLNMEAQTAVDNIYTNLDEIPTTSSMQQLQSGICLIDNETGDIIAIAGGVGEKTVFFAYNRATVQLQPGSSIKPLTIYAPAFELGLISPITVVNDLPLHYIINDEKDANGDGEPDSQTAYPRNDSKTYAYSYNILDGITKSVNGVALNTLDVMGLETSFYFARDKFRLSGLYETFVSSSGTVFSDIAYSPLGMGAPTKGVSVRDMSAAYATFANNGVWREPRTYTHVYNTDGELIMYNEQESEQILSEKTVNYINYCLINAVNKGTGTAAKVDGQEVAGKTGTTASNRDRWFCGYTTYYTAAIWCGYDQAEAINLTGVKTNPACRLFTKVMTPLHANKTSEKLYDDSEFIYVGICQDSGLLATEGCASDVRGSRVVYAYACEDDIPKQSCDKHVAVDYCNVCQAPANTYCYQFASVGKTTISKIYMVKLTSQEIYEIVKACKYGLNSMYLSNSYIYQVDDNGNDVPFYGIYGKDNAGLSYPYVVGTVHNAASWSQYKGGGYDQPEETEPEETQPEQNPTEDSGITD